MFINILEHTDECRCFSNPETMNAYLMLYKKSIGQEYITSWNGASITLPAGQTVASKYYIAKVFKCSIDKAKNYLKTLVKNSLIKVEYNQDIKQKIITIPAVNPASGARYVQMQIPSDRVHEIYTNRCKYLTNIYMYLTLHARKQNGTSYINNGDVLRGELVDTLHAIAAVCGCCVKTVSNVLANLKKKGLLIFEAIKNVAMKVKLLLYPALKANVKNVARTFVNEDAKKDVPTLNNKVDVISLPKNSTETKNEEIIQTPVTEYIRHLLFDKKKNNNVSILNNVIAEVNKAVEHMNFPIEKLHEALDALYEKNKNEGDKQITATMIISFLKGYKENLILQANQRRIETEKEQEFLKQKAIKEKELSDLDSSWQLVAKAEAEVKTKGQLVSFNAGEITQMYYLLNVDGINGHTLLKRGQLLSFMRSEVLANNRFKRSAAWSEDVIAQAVLLERLLGNGEVSQEAISKAYELDKKSKKEAFHKFVNAYEMEKKARETGRH